MIIKGISLLSTIYSIQYCKHLTWWVELKQQQASALSVHCCSIQPSPEIPPHIPALSRKVPPSLLHHTNKQNLPYILMYTIPDISRPSFLWPKI